MPRRPFATQPEYDEALTRSDSYDGDIGLETDIEMALLDPAEALNEELGVETGDEPTPLTDEQILDAATQELNVAQGGEDSDVSDDRIRALRFYNGQMMKAPPGRSQAVSTDVADVIEWTMPQVVSALCDGSGVVSFDATSEQDEDQAQLETEAVEHVLHKENDGFLYIYSCVKDGLMQKNGIGKVYQDQSTEMAFESYTGLTREEMEVLLDPQDGSTVMPVSYSEQTSENITMMPLPAPPQPGMPPPQPVPMVTYDIEVKRLTTNNCVKVESIPPEEFLWNRDHPSIDLADARFCAHHRIIMAGDLVAEGWDPELVDTLPPYGTSTNGERENRFFVDGEDIEWDEVGDSSEGSSRLVSVYECYMRIDADGDGLPECIQVTLAGEDNYQLMGWEYVNGNPFVGTTPILMTHKFLGHSLYDRCREIQEQKTEVVRQLQDNLSHQNNSRLLVVAGQVNLDDLLTSRPGGIVRQKAPGMVEQLVSPQVGDMGYKQLEYLDSVRTGRAGVSPDTASVVDAIAGDTAHGLERLMSAKEELTGLMIRLFAHTLYKNTVRKVRSLLQRHRNTPIHFKQRGRWQQVNPSEWQNRTGVTVNTALSKGDRVQRLGALQTVLQQQQLAIEAGGLGTIVTEGNVYNAVCDYVRATTLGDPSPYWQDPDSEEAQAFRQQQEQQAAEEAQKAEQMQAGMLGTQAAIEGNKELTKRLKAMADDAEKQRQLLFSYQELAEKTEARLGDLQAKYDEMELKYNADVPGKGMVGGAAAAKTTESGSVLDEEM